MIYVCGFLFTHDRRHVALIHKLKPDWQRGKFNGIGGKLEANETISEAMVREFHEETGVWIPPYYWERFLTMKFVAKDEVVHFFKAELQSNRIVATLESKTDELVGWYKVSEGGQILDLPTLPNLAWVIPMALSGNKGAIELEQYT
jgi:8-oxo-dGTP diphosphatase